MNSEDSGTAADVGEPSPGQSTAANNGSRAMTAAKTCSDASDLDTWKRFEDTAVYVARATDKYSSHQIQKKSVQE